ncbi:hypothetical protein PI124_g16905 [Phytophthora idaei]|nr:hypothetical protein PI124_g16905 [Phytophthora idaei]
MTSRQVPDKWVKWERGYGAIVDGTYEVQETPDLTQAKLGDEGWSDFEYEDGIPTALPSGPESSDVDSSDGSSSDSR